MGEEVKLERKQSPCINCKSGNIVIDIDDRKRTYVDIAVVCNNCGLRGPLSEMKHINFVKVGKELSSVYDEATKNWNALWNLKSLSN